MRYGKWLAAMIAASMLSLPAGIEAREGHFEGGSEDGVSYDLYELHMGSGEFDRPVEVTFPCRVPADTDVSVVHYEDGEWKPLLSFVDEAAGTVTACFDSFSPAKVVYRPVGVNPSLYYVKTDEEEPWIQTLVKSQSKSASASANEETDLNRSVETAQRRVEQQNYSIRKKTLEYDDVMNRQRTVVYELRGEVLKSQSAHEKILDVFNDIILTQCERYLCGEKDSQPEDLVNWIVTTFPIALTVDEVLPFRETPDKAGELIYQRVADAYELKCSMEDQTALPYLERFVFLGCIDRQWQDFLRAMDELRQGVNLRAYGHRDPLVEYKREAYGMFEVLMTNIKTEVAISVFRAQTVRNFMRQNTARSPEVVTVHNDVNILADMTQDPALAGQPMPPPEDIIPLDVPDAAIRSFDAKMKAMSDTPTPPSVRMAMIDGKQIGRNDPCPCGSGKKYKKCCGRGL